MRGSVLCALLLAALPAQADVLPRAIDCYQTATNQEDIKAYMACFTQDAVMIDVSRQFSGQQAIRAWALREVIPNGKSFAHRRILESGEGFARTEVSWLSWIVQYSYWWDADGRITRMSLQYSD